MNIDNSVDWDVDRSFGDKVCRGDNSGVYSAVDAEFGSGDGEVVEL